MQRILKTENVFRSSEINNAIAFKIFRFTYRELNSVRLANLSSGRNVMAFADKSLKIAQEIKVCNSFIRSVNLVYKPFNRCF